MRLLKSLLIALVVLVPVSLTFAQDGAVTIDQIDGTTGDGTIDEGATLTFHMRFNNNTGYPLAVVSNGFSFFSHDLTWDAVTAERNDAYNWDLNDGFPCFFDLGFYLNVFDEGPGYTIVGVGGGKGNFGTGLPVGFDDVAFTMTIGPIHGAGNLVLDTSFYEPAGYWLWGASGGIQFNPSWEGARTLSTFTCCGPFTYLEQDPIYLKDLADRVLRVYVEYEDVANVDLNSVLVQGKIPPYTEARIEDGKLVTDVFIFRFLSAWRPIFSSVQSTYTIEYLVAGEKVVLTGPVNISVPAGDLNLDGETNQADMVFMAEHLWNGGPISELEEMMDVDQNGRVDVMDLMTLSNLAGF